MGLRNLPSKTWQVNCGWVIAANIAADLTAWTRLLGCHGDPDLRDAAPDTLRYRIWHIPARLTRHARERVLRISPELAMEGRVPHLLAAAVRPAGTRLTSTSHPATREEDDPARSEPVRTRASRAPRTRPAPGANRHQPRKRAPAQSVSGPQAA